MKRNYNLSMKRSNLLLIILSFIFLSGIYITDRVLAVQYLKINLGDPFKNYHYQAVQPFKALRITGGNGYAIHIQQGKNYNIRVMKTRKSFFSMKTSGDTLTVTFTVANQNQKPETCPVGVIITVPKITFLQLSGTNNEIGPFLQDSLIVWQETNTVTRLKDLSLGYLNLQGSGISYFDFLRENRIEHVAVKLQNRAAANFNQISVEQFSPVLKDTSAIVLYSQSLEMLRSAVE